ncbi:MAG: GntR family transcriptional regulator [bacterium]
MTDLELRLDKDSPVPLYHQLQEHLKQLIMDGTLEPHRQLPSENELSRSFHISPMTARHALNELAQDGLIYRQQGRGTFVAERPFDHSLLQFVGFSEDMRARGLEPDSKILVWERCAPPPDVARAMGVEEGQALLRVRRLRLADGAAVGIHDVFLRGVALARRELEEKKSLYRLLEEKGVALAEAEESFEAVSATEEEGRLLEIAPGSPLLRVHRLTFDQSGAPVEHVVATYRADLYRYTIRIKR